MVGPNCMGIATPGGVSLWLGTVEARRGSCPGSACVAHRVDPEAFLACGPRVGFRTVVSAGGELSRASPISSPPGRRRGHARDRPVRRDDPATRRLRRALALAAEAGKPVVCLKVGRSQAAARAALAHSGAVVGSARAFSALLRHHGALEVSDFHEFARDARGARPRAAGRAVAHRGRLGVGGECGLLADHGEEAGIPFAPLRRRGPGRLIEAFPNYTCPRTRSTAGPIDDYSSGLPGQPRAAARHRRLRRPARAGRPLAAPRRARRGVVLADRRGARRRGRGHGDLPGRDVGARDRPAAGDRRAGAGARRRAAARHARGPAAIAAWPAGARGRARPAPRERRRSPAIRCRAGALPEHDSCALLERYGVRFPPRARCASAGGGGGGLRALGGPVVVKVDGPAHKQAAGGVALGIASAGRGARGRRADGRARARRAPGRRGRRGVLRHDARPRLRARCSPSAWAGAAIEALGLAAVALAPLDDAGRARARGRGAGRRAAREPGAAAALASTLVALSRLALDRPEVDEIDVNPLILGADGATAVDALVVVKGAP